MMVIDVGRATARARVRTASEPGSVLRSEVVIINNRVLDQHLQYIISKDILAED